MFSATRYHSLGYRAFPPRCKPLSIIRAFTPYYLRQRSEEGRGPDTARLIKFAKDLDVNHYPEIASWKLAVARSGIVAIK